MVPPSPAASPPPRYFEEIFNASGNLELVKQYGDWFTYDKNPRAQIFRRNHSQVHDVDSMVRLMRWGLPPAPKNPLLGVASASPRTPSLCGRALSDLII